MSSGEINRWSEVPYYRQIAAALRERIEQGELEPGQRLPSEVSMMREFGVARGTTRKALAVLRDEGLVETVRQRGSRVRPRGEWKPPGTGP